jgi:fatty acid desaturase
MMASHMTAVPMSFDPSRIDYDAFLDDIRALRREVEAALGEEDLRHLRRMEALGRGFSALGYATAGLCPNPVSAVSIALGRGVRWMLMHHIGHRGYDKVPGVPAKYTSRVFARGKRRFLDWPDWMVPEAWIYEHNVLHHSHTGETRDPDLLERNMQSLHDSAWPAAVKYAALAFYALTWKFTYYAPNTLRTFLHRHEKGDGSQDPQSLELAWSTLLWRSYLPYATLHFGAIPALYLAFFGPWAWLSALSNSLAAEALTNLHTFLVIGPNHAGDDLYRFEDRPASRAEGYVRQVVGSVNYATGSDTIDFAHLWLNYQIEHHVFPDLPMRQYRLVKPRLEALCARHGIPYVQENVLRRARKMVDIFLDRAKMKRSPPAPWQAKTKAAASAA